MQEIPMLIAVASTTGAEVDQHFGHAERFLIFDYGSGNPQPLKEVGVDKYCSYDPEHPFRHRQFDAIVAALQGCKAVVTAMIGELPKQELRKVGIEPILATGPIAAALQLAHAAVCRGGCQKRKSCRQL
jgi:predicted Fe-Mo cluster-binding NifX family protein